MELVIKLVVIVLFLALLMGLKIRRSIASTKAVQAWFANNATEFLSGHVHAEHSLFRTVAKKLAHEPDAPGPVKHGVLWNVGQGKYRAHNFLLFKHSPAVRLYPPTWRVVVEGSTGLTAADVLVISGHDDKVFASGRLAKTSMSIVPPPSSWEWAQIRAKSTDSASKWLTAERGKRLQGLLSRGRALQIYPDFVMYLTTENDVIQFATQCLDHSTDLVDTQASIASAEPEETIEDRVDWYPMRRSHYWTNVKIQADKKRLRLRSEPDSLITLVTGMFVLGYLTLLAVAIYEATVDSSYVVGLALVVAIAAFGAKIRRRSWQVAELDFANHNFQRGYGRSLDNCTDSECYDLSNAVALQVLKDMYQTSSSGSSTSIGTSNVISLELNIVFGDGSRVHLMEFSREDIYDDEDRFKLPELVTTIKEISGLRIIQFT